MCVSVEVRGQRSVRVWSWEWVIMEVLTNIEVQACVWGDGRSSSGLTCRLKLRAGPQCTAARMDARAHVRRSDRKPKMSVTFLSSLQM